MHARLTRASGAIAALTLCGALASCGERSTVASSPARAGQRTDQRLAELEQRLAKLKTERGPRSTHRAPKQRQIVPSWATEEKPAAPMPRMHRMFIPFPAKRKQEMLGYAERHYGKSTYRLQAPKVLVEHNTVTSDVQSAYDTFAADVADSELHELPGTCSHYVIARDGTIYQLVPLTIMCRHTVGLNYTAIGIEHVGPSDQQVLSNGPQLRASLRLSRWLRCRYRISIKNVIGHNESLSSPYHYERVGRLRSQTHDDWIKRNMETYRGRLRALSC